MAQSLSNLPIGAKVKFGKHSVNGEMAQPIIWLVVSKYTGATISGKPQNSVTLLTEKSVDYRCFDAVEPSSPVASSGGFAKYSVSNIRQWLNSSATSGLWYSAQHSYDYPPSAYQNNKGEIVDTTWFKTYYGDRPGFLYYFSEVERNAIMNTSIDESFIYDGATQTTTLTNQKLFLPARDDLTTNWEYFTVGGRLRCYPTSQSVSYSPGTNQKSVDTEVYWWTRTQYSTSKTDVYYVYGGSVSSGGTVCRGSYAVRPAMNLSSSLKISDGTDSDGCYTVEWNSAPPAPSTITVPASIYGGKSNTISWSGVTDPDGNSVTYQLEYAANGGSYTQLYSGTALSYAHVVPFGTNTVTYRVKATDTAPASSAYTTSATRTVVNNNAPAISGTDANLGTKSSGFTGKYTITDTNGNAVTVTEAIDGKQIRAFSATLGTEVTYSVTGNTWLGLSNGSHTLTITATDGLDTTVRTYTFTKSVNTLKIQNATPWAASTKPSRIMLVVTRNVPSPATFKVEVCNNGYDSSPTWEDATAAVLSGLVHVFTNTTKTATNWGVRFRITVARNGATGACYISAIGGNFE